jgi:hypothetical protein
MGMTHCTGFVGALVFGCLLAVVPVSSAQVASDEPSSSGGLAPTPGLTPGQVVQIQLEALRLNDSRNRGIEVAFRFASPDNKLHTGPLPRFISMIHQRPYSLMVLSIAPDRRGVCWLLVNRCRHRKTPNRTAGSVLGAVSFTWK